MNANTNALLAAFERAKEREPADLLSAIRGLPDPGALPSPWETWTLIGLVRHRERQQAGGTEVGEAVLLALEHAPQHALPLIRKGLLADIPINRREVAAILARIGKPWSRRELFGDLEASDEQEKTADVRAALAHPNHPESLFVSAGFQGSTAEIRMLAHFRNISPRSGEP